MMLIYRLVENQLGSTGDGDADFGIIRRYLIASFLCYKHADQMLKLLTAENVNDRYFSIEAFGTRDTHCFTVK
jgi:hypothetical protein